MLDAVRTSSLSQSNRLSVVGVQDQSRIWRSSYRNGTLQKIWKPNQLNCPVLRLNTNECRPRPPLLSAHTLHRMMMH